MSSATALHPVPAGAASSSRSIRWLYEMVRIRACEERLMSLPRPGFQLLSAGEEALAVGVCSAMEPGDQLLTSGRAIAPALARGVPAGEVLAELLGRAAGPCKGRAGRGHLSKPAVGFFGAHAVVGGNLTVAAGAALAVQHRGSPLVVVCIFGDGACGAGALHETMNIAALWRLPLILVCANNQYSVSTPVSAALAPRRLSDLARPFGIPAMTVDGMDVETVGSAMSSAVSLARAGGGPSFIEGICWRFSPHSTSSRETRSVPLLESWRERCPIAVLTKRLRSSGVITAHALDALGLEAEAEAEAALRFALDAPLADPLKALADGD